MTGIEVPLEVAALLCAGFTAAGAWAGSLRANRRLDPRRDPTGGPLGPLHRPEIFAQAVDLAARRNAMRASSQAVLHGRIDQLQALGTVWSSDTHAEVREHVAAVMRASLRRGDRMAQTEGHAFTIILGGTDEHAAVRIANRLRRKLGQLRLPQMGAEAPLSASFGVAAAERFGNSEDALIQRARRAFDAALATGDGHVVPASEIEEIMLLPAPASAHPTAAERGPGTSASAA